MTARARLQRLTDRRPGSAGNESGATLILVLLLITVVALVVGVTLAMTDTSIRTTITVRAVAAKSYDAQGAVDAAINTLRTNTYNNDVTSSSYPKCFGNTATSDTLVLPNFYPGSTGTAAASAAVTCSPDPSTGAAGPLVPINSANKPGNAILTLSTNSGEDGIYVKPLNNEFLVHGSVVSNSNIVASNGALHSNTSVFAHTGCSGTIIATPAAVCNAGTAADPNYAAETATVPSYRAAPDATSANCPGKLVIFLPGYYDDASALNAITNGNGSSPCKGGVWWFKPGIYYFDFHNSSNPLLSGSSDVWTVGDGQLIAGNPVDASGNVINKPTVPITVPNSCQSPIKSTSANGVQFIFGGDSRLQVSGSADAEICGTYHSDRPPIALYGLKSGVETPIASTVTKLSSVPSTDANFGATASVPNLVDSDALSASWAKTGSNSQTGTFTVSGFAPASTIPAGSVLNSASLTVKYQNTAGATQDTRTVVITPKSATGIAGTPISVTLPSTSGNGIQTATVDLYGSGTGALAAAVHSLGYSGASAAYSIQTKHAGTEKVDTVQLNLGYTPPALRGETTTAVPGNCLASIGGCALHDHGQQLPWRGLHPGHHLRAGCCHRPDAEQPHRPGDAVRSDRPRPVGQGNRSVQLCRPGDRDSGQLDHLRPGRHGALPERLRLRGGSHLQRRVRQARPARPGAGLRPSGTPSPPSRQIIVQSWAMQR